MSMVHFSFGMKKPERESVSAVGMEVYWRSVASLICALPGDCHTVADALAAQAFSVAAAAGAG
jgi:hypothetical protein